MSQRNTGRWFEQQRQEWIGEMLRIFGFINRAHLQRKFGISDGQASVDFQRFQRANPTLTIYDKSQRCYRFVVDGLPVARE